ncbi:hypothetical protein HYT33_03815 [Candidatus Roizmanbacteria bacterium]|nr:hypothetical protein [Candidatus Roizmanbacteria bacterium]
MAQLRQSRYHHHPHYRVFVGIVAVLAIGLWLLSLYVFQLQKPQTKSVEEAAPTSKETAVFQTQNQKTRFAVGENVVLNIAVSSDGRDIVGMDFLVGYDMDAFSFSTASVLLPSWTLAQVDRESKVSLTVSKNPDIQTPSVFDSTKVVRVVFTPKKRGKYTFSLLPATGAEKTQLVDVSVTRIFPTVNNLTVEIY